MVSAATVSRIVAQLDAEQEAFRTRPLPAPARHKANESTMTWGFGSARIKNFFSTKEMGFENVASAHDEKDFILHLCFILHLLQRC